jgi:S-adenosylmethionine:tRNA-ribosyltransferase-isomerase (queuine synthetase)
MIFYDQNLNDAVMVFNHSKMLLSHLVCQKKECKPGMMKEVSIVITEITQAETAAALAYLLFSKKVNTLKETAIRSSKVAFSLGSHDQYVPHPI